MSPDPMWRGSQSTHAFSSHSGGDIDDKDIPQCPSIEMQWRTKEFTVGEGIRTPDPLLKY